MFAFELILSLIMVNILTLPDNLPSSDVGDEWTSFKNTDRLDIPHPLDTALRKQSYLLSRKLCQNCEPAPGKEKLFSGGGCSH